jgi:hypothetical protein
MCNLTISVELYYRCENPVLQSSSSGQNISQENKRTATHFDILKFIKFKIPYHLASTSLVSAVVMHL